MPGGVGGSPQVAPGLTQPVTAALGAPGGLCNPGRGGAVGVAAGLASVSQPRAAPRVQWKRGLEWKVKKQQPNGRVGRGSPSPWQRHRAMEAAAGQRRGPAASVPAARPDPRAQPPARSGRRREGPGQPLASPESGKEMQVQRGRVGAGAALRGLLAAANKHTQNAERKRGQAVAERPGAGAPLPAEPLWSGRPGAREMRLRRLTETRRGKSVFRGGCASGRNLLAFGVCSFRALLVW